MSFTDRALLIVDDAKFSAAIIAKRLRAAGYTDVRVAHHAADALSLHKERPCDLLIADWLMPDINGVELCQQIRKADETQSHYTYCLLVTAKEGDNALQNAFESGLDDFIHKNDINSQLLSRVQAGLRLSQQLELLSEQNKALSARIEEQEKLLRYCPSTGLGNAHQAENALDRTYRQTEGRGGAVSYMSIQIQSWDTIKEEYRDHVSEELVAQVARKLVSLVRPLDEVCRISENEFSVVAHFKNIDDCNLGTYRRVYQGLDKQAFKTSAGFISISIGCAVCFSDAKFGKTDIASLSQFNKMNLANQTGSKSFVVQAWKQSA